ncbi:MAG: bifunctional glycosyltransferase family 2/GtrA family protein [Lachnospiraceae bacterium]|nr:bifunctional glycosyltransferase family 2/GtrA family protein [Lachnospiraceae bacterium]
MDTRTDMRMDEKTEVNEIMNTDLQGLTVIIPAYKPEPGLGDMVQELMAAGFETILVVDDGSGEGYEDIFAQARQLPGCTVLQHEVNRGKGAALRTAFRYVLDTFPESRGVVTADADGQHLVRDIVAVARAVAESRQVVLGVRDFTDPKVPARSKFGNNMTRGVFRLFFGMKIQDTQTGLRGIPTEYLEQMLQPGGDRYEYETNMLFHINRRGIPYQQVPISTVYIDENSTSHFRVVRDSIRIYGLILKYLFSSVGASVIDALVFYIMKKGAFLAFLPIPLTFTAAFIARAVSSITNYLVNAKVVFGDRAGIRTLVKYYILAIFQIMVSAVLVFTTEHLLDIWSPALSTLVKVAVDTILFFFSFRIQHKWVFGGERLGEETQDERKESNL